MCVCVFVCVRAKNRERERERERDRVRESVCVCVRERERFLSMRSWPGSATPPLPRSIVSQFVCERKRECVCMGERQSVSELERVRV